MKLEEGYAVIYRPLTFQQRAQIATDIQAAVLDEREACARVVEKTACLILPTAEVAARIRARGEKP